jgi:MHS family shikimate/dehydroshikimate transporter-like MFS transporter
MVSLIISYGVGQLGIPKGVILGATMAGSALELVTIPLVGVLSDRVGRRPVYVAGAASMAVMAFPFFWAPETREPVLVFTAVIAALNLGHVVIYGTQSAFFGEMFPTRVRYSGTSIAMQAATVIGGGLLPIIATALLGWSGGVSWPVSAYCVLVAPVIIGGALAARETHHDRLPAT